MGFQSRPLRCQAGLRQLAGGTPGSFGDARGVAPSPPGNEVDRDTRSKSDQWDSRVGLYGVKRGFASSRAGHRAHLAMPAVWRRPRPAMKLTGLHGANPINGIPESASTVSSGASPARGPDTG